jgi:hypothetical protein
VTVRANSSVLGKDVPAGEKNGSVSILTPLISRMAVAVPTWVMFNLRGAIEIVEKMVVVCLL